MDNVLTFKELYADLVEASTQSLPEGCFTVRQFAEDIDRNRQAAFRVLQGRVESGELATKKVVLNGYRTNIWWFVDSTKESNDG